MEQIRSAMEGVAYSVTELATNATELAQSVSEMSEQDAAGRDVYRYRHSPKDCE